MPDDVDRIYWDSNCFAYLIDRNEERLPILTAILDGVVYSKGRRQIVTSVLSKVEVAYALTERVVRELSDEEEARIAALWDDVTVVAPIEVHEWIVDRARLLIRGALTQGLALKPADALHLASAMSVEARTFHTYDRKLHNPRYAEMTGFPIELPVAEQPKLL